MEAASFRQHIIMEYNIKAIKQSNFKDVDVSEYETKSIQNSSYIINIGAVPLL